MSLLNSAGGHRLARPYAMLPLTALAFVACSSSPQGTIASSTPTIAARNTDIATVQTEAVASIGPASTAPLSSASSTSPDGAATDSTTAPSVLPPSTSPEAATSGSASVAQPTTAATPTTKPTATSTGSTAPALQQSLNELLALEGLPKWTLVRSDELAVAEAADADRPIHAYYSNQPHPENSQWLWVQRSDREFKPDSSCDTSYVEVFLSNRDRACLRETPGLAVRYAVDETPVIQRGNASAGVALAAAAATTIVDDFPVINDVALPAGVVDQGTFYDIGAGDRLVSAAAIENEVSYIEYAHEDGSSLVMTAVEDTAESLAALRLNDLGGWDLVDDSTGTGFSGHGRRLTDAIVAWRDGETVIQVRSTGHAGSDAIESIIARRSANG